MAHPAPAVPVAGLLLLAASAAPGESLRREFAYADFSSSAGLVVVGNAVAGDPLLLAGDQTYQRGAVWFGTPLPLFHGFESRFTFRLTPADTLPQNCNEGADGFALVVQSAGTAALGGAGFGLGYGTAEGHDGIANSLAIEFDTFANQTGDENTNDPSGDHVGAQTRGAASNSADHAATLGVALTTADLNDGEPHAARVRYADGLLSVYVDDVLQLAAITDLATLDVLAQGNATVGFTSATGLCAQQHEILTWSHDTLFTFADGFESGDTAAWSATVPPPQ